MTEPAEPSPPRVVVVAGPTAAGKTDLAIHLAKRFGGEIINADSMQVYRYLDIGTAKPTAEQRAAVPHHLIDVAEPDEQYNAGRFAEEAGRAAAAIRGRGREVFLAGGTGLYVRAFLEGLLGEAAGDPAIRARLEAEHKVAIAEDDGARMHRRLRSVDPESARQIHPRDVKRTLRALELQALTGRAPSELRRAHGFAERRYDRLYLVVDPGRAALAERIDRRCERMVETGLLQEVRRLRELGYGPELPAMQAIGYRHMQPVIDGSETLKNVLEQLKRDTRQFARRQRTWFRSVPDAVWVEPDDVAAIEGRVREFLDPERPQRPGADQPPPAVV